MTKRFFAFVFAIGLASSCAVQAQSPTPGESPAGAPAKHRTHKKAQTTASPGETAASSSPAAAPASSPTAKRARKKSEAVTSPSPSPAKFSLGELFKPKSSAATSPAAVSHATAKSTGAAAGNPPAPGGGHGRVWVNTDSHVYHKEGSRFYGTTKKGKYMTEAEAVKEGNRAAGKGE
jgi:hypothetical protein